LALELERTLDSDLKKQFDEQGYIVVRGLFSREEAETIREHFEELHARGSIEGCFASDPTSHDPLKVYPRMMHPHRISDLAMRYMTDDRVFDVLEVLFGEEAMAAQSMYYFKPPGARGQALHQDNFYLKVEPGTCIAAWTAIDYVDEENGGLVVVPGSQGMEVVCPEEADANESFTTHLVRPPEGLEELPVVMEPGDVLFFNGSVIHGSYPNKSKDRFRRSFICHYAGISCERIGKYYQPLYLRGGAPRTVLENLDAGPCGEEFQAKGPH